MAISDILASIDHDITLLQQARMLLGGSAATATGKAAGRSVKSSSKATAACATTAKHTAKKKRNLSPEGRQRIAEAVKKRWAAQKAAAAK
jgi:hypothetical protein